MELQQIVERVADIRHAKPSATVRQRVQEAAQELSRAGSIQGHVEAANESLAALVTLLYQVATDGQPANIDPRTWRLLVAAPWGRGGWRHWGLRSWEAKVLSQILRIRCESRRHPSLFGYNETARTWHLNCGEYPTIESAMEYLKRKPVTLAEWRQHHDILNAQARQRMIRLRENAG